MLVCDYGRVEKIGTKKAWEIFLAQYPSGFYADLARENLATIERTERLQAEQDRLAKVKLEEQRAQAENERLAKEQAERERLGKELAERERLAKEQERTGRLNEPSALQSLPVQQKVEADTAATGLPKADSESHNETGRWTRPQC